MEKYGNRWVQHSILLTAPLLTVLDVFIVNVAVPSIKKGLHASDGEIQLVIAAYLLGYASFQITGGRAGDYFGRKKVFFWGMVFFTLASCLCGLAATPFMLITARFFQGVSGGFMMPQALSYVQLLFPESKERTKAIGLIGITLGLASVLGQFLGGLFSDMQGAIEGWRYIFFINLPIGIVGLWATSRFLIETKINKTGKFDYSGVLILTIALGALIYPLTQGREMGWPLWSFVSIGMSVLLGVFFIRDQHRKQHAGKNSLIDLKLFRIRDFNLGLGIVSLHFMMHTSYLLIATIYFQNGLKLGAFETGLYFIWFGGFFTLSSLLSIKLVHAFGKPVIQFGVLMIITSLVLQSIYFRTTLDHVTFVLILSLYGLGGGLVLPSLMNIALRSIPSDLVGGASGVYNTIQQASSSIGICLVGGIFFYYISKTASATTAFHIGLYAEMCCAAGVFLLLLLVPNNIKK
ncbi:MFS transporter [Fluviicola sp.]|uniref:MFS transporter n=1 Tax=Fluviicola sp. TaxID=1917219 RepID=UPI0031D1DC06